MIPFPQPGVGAKRPVVTWSLIGVNFAVFLFFYLQGPHVFTRAIEGLGMTPYYIIRGERLYTLITSMFMHGGWAHIIGNMIYLYVFGCPLESRLGRLRFIAFYIVSGLLASLIHIAVELTFAEPMITYSPYGEPTIVDPLLMPCVGASGAISGLLGAYLNLFPRSRLHVMTFFFLFAVIEIPAYIFLVVWFLYQLWMGFMAIATNYFAGVAFWAHIGGFITGWLMTIPARAPRRRSRVVYYRGRVWYEIPVEIFKALRGMRGALEEARVELQTVLQVPCY
ncbi:MAG: rhomboid family intramembrane serine protease [Thermoprotei archaeon]|nr:MAG: rhomboid family intramembrane serine protease [Thermoprotei archaeon]